MAIGPVKSVHLFRERRAPWNHEYALICFQSSAGDASWLRVERAARFKHRFLQTDSFGPVISGAPLRETASVGCWKEQLIGVSSPADEIVSVSLPNKGLDRRDAARGLFIVEVIGQLEQISRVRPEYKLFSANCRYFARRTTLSLAERLHALAVYQHAVSFHWRDKNSSFEKVSYAIQGDPFGGRQVDSGLSVIARAQTLFDLAFQKRRDGFPLEALGVSQEALDILHDINDNSPARKAAIIRGSVQSFYAHQALGDIASALDDIQQAGTIIRASCRDAAVIKETGPLCGIALNILSTTPRPNLSVLESAVIGSREAADIYSQLFAADPTRFTRDYVSSLFTVAENLEKVGSIDEAVASSLKALEIRRIESRTEPSTGPSFR